MAKMKKNKPEKPMMMKGGKAMRAQNPMATLKRIFSYLKPYKGRIALILSCLLAHVGCSVGGTYLLGLITNEYILPLAYNAGFVTDTAYAARAAEVTIGAFGGIVVGLASIYVFGALMHYLYNYSIMYVSSKVLQNVRDEIFVKLQRLPIKYFDTHTHGELMSLYTNDTDTLRELLSGALPSIISNMLTIVSIFVMMMVISPVLTLCIIVLIVVATFITKFIAGKSGKHFIGQQKAVGELNGYVEEHIEGLKVVKVFCHEEQEKKDFDAHNGKLHHAAKKAHTYANGCDRDCDVCGAPRTPAAHVYDDDTDASCNVCGATRTIVTPEDETPADDEPAADDAEDEAEDDAEDEADDEAEDETTEAAEEGCGGTVAGLGALLALTASFGFAFVGKKKED